MNRKFKENIKNELKNIDKDKVVQPMLTKYSTKC